MHWIVLYGANNVPCEEEDGRESGLMKTTHTLGTDTKQRIPAVEMPATNITTQGIGTNPHRGNKRISHV